MSLRLLLMLILLLCSTPAAALTLVDDSGQTLEFQAPFQRIISLYAAHTENLFCLGAGAQVVAVSTSETHLPQALAKPALSYRDDPERLLALKPDLVLVRPMIARGHPGLVASLARAGVAVVSLQPRGAREMFAYWQRLGLLCGRQAEARAMIAQFQRQLAQLQARVAQAPLALRPKVYFESIHRRMKTFAPSSTAIMALQAAGGINLAADAQAVRGSNIAAYGKERILAHAENMDVYLAQVGAMNRVNREHILREPGFGALRAVRLGRVHLVDEELVSRPTPRLLQGIREIQQLLFPAMKAQEAEAAP